MKYLKKMNEIEEEIKKEMEKNNKNGLCLKSKNHVLILFIKGKEKNWRQKILEHSKYNLLNNGIFNETRNCYYPFGKDTKDIAEKNKLEKLFKKWGFRNI